jgi:hypothetical protein
LFRRGFTCMIYSMKYYVAVASVLVAAALAVPTQGVTARDRVVADSAALGGTNSPLSSSTLKNDFPIQPPITTPSGPASSSDLRDVPSINGRYSIGGRILLPYIGGGFSGGYGSEFNRSLGGAPPVMNDFGLRSQFGQSVFPNEFQMGIRIPF